MPAMAAAAIDTLRYARRLKDAGVPTEQAEAMADAIGSELVVQLVTKTDLEVAIAGLEARIGDRIGKVEISLATMRTDVDAAIAALDARIGDRIGKVESSLATQRTEFDVLIAGQNAEFNERFGKLESSIAVLRWMMGFTLAFVVALSWRAFA